MDIYIVRHAIAVPRGDESLDHARPLSDEGRERFGRAAKGLTKLGVDLDRALHSPWVRARQTAELLVERVGGERVETEALAKTPGPELLRQIEGDVVALVGHEPWMGELIALLLLGDPASGQLFPLKKGAIAHLVGEPVPGGCALAALFPPKALRAIARS